MTKEKKQQYGHFKKLLLFLLLYIFISPFLAPHANLLPLVRLGLSAIFLQSIWSTRAKKNNRIWATFAIIPVIALYWLGIYGYIPFTHAASYLIFALYFLFLVNSYIRQLITTKQITIKTLYATLCLYLITGLFWGSLYSFFYEINPNSFQGNLLGSNPEYNAIVFNYFSIVTLTTLGYGDITPNTLAATSLCQIEAIFGQFFTTVLVAWLVGNFARERKEGGGPPSNNEL